MADLVITVGNVLWVSGPRDTQLAAETITAGDCLYAASTTTVGVATNNDTTKTTLVGIALNGASANQPVQYAGSGAVVTIGATIVIGIFYVLSVTGAISASADAASPDFVSGVGWGLTTANMTLAFQNTGVAIA